MIHLLYSLSTSTKLHHDFSKDIACGVDDRRDEIFAMKSFNVLFQKIIF